MEVDPTQTDDPQDAHQLLLRRKVTARKSTHCSIATRVAVANAIKVLNPAPSTRPAAAVPALGPVANHGRPSEARNGRPSPAGSTAMPTATHHSGSTPAAAATGPHVRVAGLPAAIGKSQAPPTQRPPMATMPPTLNISTRFQNGPSLTEPGGRVLPAYRPHQQRAKKSFPSSPPVLSLPPSRLKPLLPKPQSPPPPELTSSPLRPSPTTNLKNLSTASPPILKFSSPPSLKLTSPPNLKLSQRRMRTLTPERQSFSPAGPIGEVGVSPGRTFARSILRPVAGVAVDQPRATATEPCLPLVNGTPSSREADRKVVPVMTTRSSTAAAAVVVTPSPRTSPRIHNLHRALLNAPANLADQVKVPVVNILVSAKPVAAEVDVGCLAADCPGGRTALAGSRAGPELVEELATRSSPSPDCGRGRRARTRGGFRRSGGVRVSGRVSGLTVSVEDAGGGDVRMPPLLSPSETSCRVEPEERSSSQSPEMPVLYPAEVAEEGVAVAVTPPPPPLDPPFPPSLVLPDDGAVGCVASTFFVAPVSTPPPQQQQPPPGSAPSSDSASTVGSTPGSDESTPSRRQHRKEVHFQGRYAYMVGKRVKDIGGESPIRRIPFRLCLSRRLPRLGRWPRRRSPGRPRGRPHASSGGELPVGHDRPAPSGSGYPHVDIIDGLEFYSFDSEADLRKFVRRYPTRTLDIELAALEMEATVAAAVKTPAVAVSAAIEATVKAEEESTEVVPEQAAAARRIFGDPIRPTKTRDVTKIKGWRCKVFAEEALSASRRAADHLRRRTHEQEFDVLQNLNGDEADSEDWPGDRPATPCDVPETPGDLPATPSDLPAKMKEPEELEGAAVAPELSFYLPRQLDFTSSDGGSGAGSQRSGSTFNGSMRSDEDFGLDSQLDGAGAGLEEVDGGGGGGFHDDVGDFPLNPPIVIPPPLPQQLPAAAPSPPPPPLQLPEPATPPQLPEPTPPSLPPLPESTIPSPPPANIDSPAEPVVVRIKQEPQSDPEPESDAEGPLSEPEPPPPSGPEHKFEVLASPPPEEGGTSGVCRDTIGSPKPQASLAQKVSPTSKVKGNKSAFICDSLDEFLRSNVVLKTATLTSTTDARAAKGAASIETRVVWPAADACPRSLLGAAGTESVAPVPVPPPRVAPLRLNLVKVMPKKRGRPPKTAQLHGESRFAVAAIASQPPHPVHQWEKKRTALLDPHYDAELARSRKKSRSELRRLLLLQEERSDQERRHRRRRRSKTRHSVDSDTPAGPRPLASLHSSKSAFSSTVPPTVVQVRPALVGGIGPATKRTIEPVILSATDAHFAASSILAHSLWRKGMQVPTADEIRRLCHPPVDNGDSAQARNARSRACQEFCKIISPYMALMTATAVVSLMDGKLPSASKQPPIKSAAARGLAVAAKLATFRTIAPAPAGAPARPVLSPALAAPDPVPVDCRVPPPVAVSGGQTAASSSSSYSSSSPRSRTVWMVNLNDDSPTVVVNPSTKKQASPAHLYQSPDGADRCRPSPHECDIGLDPDEDEPYPPLPDAAGAGSGCGEVFCRLGCVCTSLQVRRRKRRHCGKVLCMFSCTCFGGLPDEDDNAVFGGDRPDRGAGEGGSVPHKRRRQTRLPAKLQDSAYRYGQGKQTLIRQPLHVVRGAGRGRRLWQANPHLPSPPADGSVSPPLRRVGRPPLLQVPGPSMPLRGRPTKPRLQQRAEVMMDQKAGVSMGLGTDWQRNCRFFVNPDGRVVPYVVVPVNMGKDGPSTARPPTPPFRRNAAQVKQTARKSISRQPHHDGATRRSVESAAGELPGRSEAQQREEDVRNVLEEMLVQVAYDVDFEGHLREMRNMSTSSVKSVRRSDQSQPPRRLPAILRRRVGGVAQERHDSSDSVDSQPLDPAAAPPPPALSAHPGRLDVSAPAAAQFASINVRPLFSVSQTARKRVGGTCYSGDAYRAVALGPGVAGAPSTSDGVSKVVPFPSKPPPPAAVRSGSSSASSVDGSRTSEVEEEDEEELEEREAENRMDDQANGDADDWTIERLMIDEGAGDDDEDADPEAKTVEDREIEEVTIVDQLEEEAEEEEEEKEGDSWEDDDAGARTRKAKTRRRPVPKSKPQLSQKLPPSRKTQAKVTEDDRARLRVIRKHTERQRRRDLHQGFKDLASLVRPVLLEMGEVEHLASKMSILTKGLQVVTHLQRKHNGLISNKKKLCKETITKLAYFSKLVKSLPDEHQQEALAGISKELLALKSKTVSVLIGVPSLKKVHDYFTSILSKFLESTTEIPEVILTDSCDSSDRSSADLSSDNLLDGTSSSDSADEAADGSRGDPEHVVLSAHSYSRRPSDPPLPPDAVERGDYSRIGSVSITDREDAGVIGRVVVGSPLRRILPKPAASATSSRSSLLPTNNVEPSWVACEAAVTTGRRSGAPLEARKSQEKKKSSAGRNAPSVNAARIPVTPADRRFRKCSKKQILRPRQDTSSPHSESKLRRKSVRLPPPPAVRPVAADVGVAAAPATAPAPPGAAVGTKTKSVPKMDLIPVKSGATFTVRDGQRLYLLKRMKMPGETGFKKILTSCRIPSSTRLLPSPSAVAVVPGTAKVPSQEAVPVSEPEVTVPALPETPAASIAAPPVDTLVTASEVPAASISPIPELDVASPAAASASVEREEDSLRNSVTSLPKHFDDASPDVPSAATSPAVHDSEKRSRPLEEAPVPKDVDGGDLTPSKETPVSEDPASSDTRGDHGDALSATTDGPTAGTADLRQD